jgi:hypothetical protein
MGFIFVRGITEKGRDIRVTNSMLQIFPQQLLVIQPETENKNQSLHFWNPKVHDRFHKASLAI